MAVGASDDRPYQIKEKIAEIRRSAKGDAALMDDFVAQMIKDDGEEHAINAREDVISPVKLATKFHVRQDIKDMAREEGNHATHEGQDFVFLQQEHIAEHPKEATHVH